MTGLDIIYFSNLNRLLVPIRGETLPSVTSIQVILTSGIVRESSQHMDGDGLQVLLRVPLHKVPKLFSYGSQRIMASACGDRIPSVGRRLPLPFLVHSSTNLSCLTGVCRGDGGRRKGGMARGVFVLKRQDWSHHQGDLCYSRPCSQSISCVALLCASNV